jgi:hypothetical protein
MLDALPGRALSAIRDRWMLKKETEGLMCPERAQLDASIASAARLRLEATATGAGVAMRAPVA